MKGTRVKIKETSLCLFVVASMMLPLSASAADMLSYENSTAGVKLKYPADWIKSEALPGAVVAFGVPKEKANLKMVENISLTIQDLTPDATLDKYTAAYEKERKNNPDGPKVLESRKTTLGGQPAQRIVCVGMQNGMEIEFLQVWTIRKQKSYLITYGSSKETYAKFSQEAEKIISSLVFI